MAEIVPFAGLRYDLTRVGDAARVLAPPYDVIGEAERSDLEAREPHNIVRVELPRGEGDARYGAAANLLRAWIAEGVLRREPTPAMYLYEQQFTWAGKAYTRQGFIAALRLEPFDKRVVLPHERTLTGPKEDRRKLLVTTRTQISQVFGLYRDADGAARAELEAVSTAAPALDATTTDGTRHRLWVITEAARLNKLAGIMSDKQVLIADGHHRYETMVSLRGELRGAGGAGAREPADYGAMYLAPAEDPGLLVLPTHRLVKGLEGFSQTAFLAAAAAAFDVIPGEETTAQAVEARLEQLSVGADGQRRVAFGLRAAGKRGPTWLVLKPIVDLSALGPPALRALDVTVLHGVLLG
ncbi:MAG TPA: DUF1015 domain-containing protein, partial [Polyangia bacterium]|nr:DUF1015 domain-containing protein [Polyangia bacterium]